MNRGEERKSRQYVRYLQEALCNGDVVRTMQILTELGDSTQDYINESYKGQSVLQVALLTQDIQLLTLVLDAGANINTLSTDETTSLILACQLNYEQAVELLISRGSDVSLPNSQGHTPLSEACLQQSLRLAKLLIKSGADVDFSNEKGDSALHHAVRKQNNNIVELLARNNSDVDHMNKERMSALMIAASLGNTDIVQTLILAGCDLELSDSRSCTALMLSVQSGHASCVRLLLQCGADPSAADNKRASPLLHAVLKQHSAIVDLILSHPIGRTTINMADYEMTTPISQATRQATQFGAFALDSVAGHMFSRLLETGCDVNIAQVHMNWTPLFLSCFTGNVALTKRLLACGPDLTLRDKSGDSVLHTALFTGAPQLISLLIDSGSEVNACNRNDETALYMACLRKSDIKIIELLLSSGADVDVAISSNKNTALHAAIERGYTEAALLLIDHDADINHKDSDGSTPLSKAILYGVGEVVDRLISTDHCKVNAGSRSVPLHEAVTRTDESLMKQLLLRGADINQTNQTGMRPIQIAVEANQRRIIRALLSYGCTLDATEDHTLLVPKSCCHTYHDDHPHAELQPLFACIKFDDVELFSLLLSYYHRQPSSLLQTLHDLLTIAFDTGSRVSQMLSSANRTRMLELLRDEISAPWSLLQLCRGQIRRSLSTFVSEKVRQLQIPVRLKHYLLYDREQSLDLSDLNSQNDFDYFSDLEDQNHLDNFIDINNLNLNNDP